MKNKLDRARELLEKGCHAYEKGKLARAVNLFHQAAELGSNEAKVNLGNMYCSGEGAPANLPLAKELYRSAFKDGCVYGASALGTQYMAEGKLHLAEKWLKRAIEMGDEWAADDLRDVSLRRHAGPGQS
ncbi:tetratricopeptide repeat protein [Hydrogenophaga sp. A37]|uniref:tetratricopeptide repeat protein n=1 Tax=Hydrogenophaga sp. A37 TaxID=1945864 RepID=UPI00117B6716|nr:SEL1-like repeat protein [Hydrogenophaga sp. A37]